MIDMYMIDLIGVFGKIQLRNALWDYIGDKIKTSSHYSYIFSVKQLKSSVIIFILLFLKLFLDCTKLIMPGHDYCAVVGCPNAIHMKEK